MKLNFQSTPMLKDKIEKQIKHEKPNDSSDQTHYPSHEVEITSLKINRNKL